MWCAGEYERNNTPQSVGMKPRESEPLVGRLKDDSKMLVVVGVARKGARLGVKREELRAPERLRRTTSVEALGLLE